MRINIGCGSHYAEGWINVDIWDGVKADFYAGAADLPFPDGSAEMAYMGHVLEHLPPHKVPWALHEAHRILEPGGALVVVGPDLDRVDKERDPDLYRYVRDGGDPHRTDPYITHKWECTSRVLCSAIMDVFPNTVSVALPDLVPEWPVVSQAPWQCAFLAYKDK